jgi:hypothetical protein
LSTLTAACASSYHSGRASALRGLFKHPPDEQKQGKALRDEGAKWLARIDAANKLEKRWLDDAEKAVRAFTGRWVFLLPCSTYRTTASY